jgi:hypothetical protein
MKANGSVRKGDPRCVSDWETLRGVTNVTIICIENGCLRFISCDQQTQWITILLDKLNRSLAKKENSLHYTVAGGSLHCPQQLATCLYPEPDESNLAS